MLLLLAVSPIIFILVGIVIMKKPAWIVSLLALVFTILLAFFVWKTVFVEMLPTFQAGVKSAAQIIFLVWSAFMLLEIITVSGAMDRIKLDISMFSKDRRIQIILVALCFGTFLEGVTGAGAPAALVAPFLVGLGFKPMTAAAVALIANGVSPSLGGAGVPTIMGMDAVKDILPINDITAMTGRIHMFGYLLLPFIMLFIVFGGKCYKNIVGYIVFVGVIMSGSLLLFSNLMGPELGSLGPGVLGILATITYIKIVKPKPVDEYTSKEEYTNAAGKLNSLKAFLPYIMLIIALPLVRFTVPLATLIKIGYPVWIGVVVHLVILVNSFILGCKEKYLSCLIEAFRKVIPAFISMAALISLSNVMNMTGMMRLIAQSVASFAGPVYPALALYIGVLGAFITGSNLSSNVLFAPMHLEAASVLHQNPLILAATNNGGGALGNMICPNNVIAVSATVGLKNQEGEIMLRTVKALFIMSVVYAALVMLYIHVIFPDFRWTW